MSTLKTQFGDINKAYKSLNMEHSTSKHLTMNLTELVSEKYVAAPMHAVALLSKTSGNVVPMSYMWAAKSYVGDTTAKRLKM